MRNNQCLFPQINGANDGNEWQRVGIKSCLWLSMVGSHPSQRGKGLGSHIVSHLCNQADRVSDRWWDDAVGFTECKILYETAIIITAQTLHGSHE